MKKAVVLSVLLAGCTEPPNDPKAVLAPHWHAFAHCVVGEPLEEGESVEQRVQAIALGQPEDGDWPKRCVPFGEALKKAVFGLPFEDQEAYEFGWRQLVDLERKWESGDELGYLELSAVWSSFHELPSPEEPIPSPAAPPPIESLFPVGRLRALGPRSTHGARSVRAEDGTANVIFDEYPAVCSFPVDLATAGCTFFPDAIPRRGNAIYPGGSLGAARPALDLVFDGVYGIEDGTQLLASEVPAPKRRRVRDRRSLPVASLRAEGGTFVVEHVRDEPALLVRVRAADATVSAETIEDPAPRGFHAWAGRHLVWSDWDGGVYARTVVDDPLGLGPRVELAQTESPDRPVWCKSDEAEFLYFNDRYSFDGMAPGRLVVRLEDRWLPAVEVPPRFDLSDVANSTVMATCQGERWTAVGWAAKAPTVHLQRFACSTGGCDVEKVTVDLGGTWTTDDVAVLPVRDRIAVFWLYRDALWLKLAPLEELPNVPARPVLSTSSHVDGLMVHGIHGIHSPTGAAAMLLLDGVNHILPLRLAPDGTLSVPEIRIDPLALR